MPFDFSRPLWLLLWPLCALMIFLLAKKWPSKSKKSKISHILRHVLTLLTVLALAGMGVMGPARQKTAWLLVDASASVAQSEAEALTRQALAALKGDLQAGVIAFGENAMVETSLSDDPGFSGVRTAIDPQGTDLSEALMLAGALLPSDSAGGIAVISDGLTESADVSPLLARGIPVNTLKIPSASARDAQVTQVQAPASAYQGQAFAVTVTIHSTQDGPAQVALLKNRAAADTRDVTLRKGENTFVFQDVADATGVMTYEAQVILPGDAHSRNDRMGAYVAVSGAPAILIAEGKSGEGGELEKMLEASGMTVQTMLPGMLPDRAADYRAWHAVALVNVDADSLTENQIAALAAAARELGRGVAVFGGDSSYALGNYRGSALEEMLPVAIDVKNKLQLPTTALMLVIDKSGSMTAGQYGVTRLEVAKEAAARAVEILTEQDFVGVIAFDDAGKWVVPLTQVTDVAAIQDMIGTIRPGGGTAFYTPLFMALEALKQVSAPHKHVIFLTDGEAGDQGYEALAADMAAQGITLTAVAVGSGADVAAMLRLAELGGGRAYQAGEFDNVPKIFTKETMLVSGTYVQNRVFTPIVTDESLTDFPGFPQLSGYLAATEKPLATVSLVSDREDPILAWWQYGAGRVLCWMSDVTGAWSGQFLSWDNAAAFFGGLVSHILPDREQTGEMTVREGTLTYTLPAELADDANTVTARIVAPDGTVSEMTLEQEAPARYAAALDTGEAGAYAVEIHAQRDGEEIAMLEGGTVVSYSREYDLRVQDTGVLEELSEKTGGRAVEDAETLLDFAGSAARTRQDLSSWLMGAALLLLLLDIAQRRLDWERLLPQHAAGEKESPAPAGKSPKSKPPKLQKQKKEAPPDPAGTSNRLWENMQKRKRL